MNQIKKIIISGYYGFDNSGDDAILKAIVKDIGGLDKNIDITVLSKDPEKTKRMYPVKAVDRFKMSDVISEMRKTDLFISGGGSLLQDVTSTRSLWYYLGTMYMAKLLRRPVMIYANGIGPIEKGINRFLTRRILNRVDLITLRDEESKQYVKDLGVNNSNIEVTADPVFTLNPSPEDEIERIFKKENIPMEKDIIGISIRQWNSSKNLVQVVSQSIDYILGKYDVNVVLIPMHYPEDLNISREITDQVKANGCYVMEDKYTVEQIMGITKTFEMIIAMRLHALIYAATQEVPIVGLSYDPKVVGILRSLGMDNYCDVNHLEYDELIENIDEVWENRENLRIKLKQQEEKLEEKALDNVRLVLELLKK